MKGIDFPCVVGLTLTYIVEIDALIVSISEITKKDKVYNFSEKDFVKFVEYPSSKDDFKSFKKIITEIFNYDDFISDKNISDNRWGAYNFVKAINLSTCPICNRNYIHTYESKTGKCRADVDHYYPKSIYPFLSVCLYNFIPTCHICNSSFKGSIDTFLVKSIYPYTEEYGDNAKFKTEFYTDSDTVSVENNSPLNDEDKYDIKYLYGNSDNFKITLENTNNEENYKVENSINIFHIENLYNFHKDYVRELIKKAIVYNESRIDEIYNNFSELYENREEVVRMVIGNYINEEDLGKRPLAKLTKDICKELGLK
jgi:hypothetical protein